MPVPRGLRHPELGQVMGSSVNLPDSSPRVAAIQPYPTPRLFRRLDQDGSRVLDARELRRGLAELGMALGEAEAEGVCKRWDRDGSGTLDLEEFLRALRVRPTLGIQGHRVSEADSPLRIATGRHL